MSFTWTKQSIEWLEKAAKFTTYYQDLVKICKPFLLQSDSLIDIGCGTGSFSLAFAPYVQAVTALDINPMVIELLRQKCQDLNLNNIVLKQGDWQELPSHPVFDTVFMSYINGLASEQLYQLARLASRLIIGVLPKQGRERSFGLEGYIPSETYKNSDRHTFPKAVAYLQSKGIPFQAMEHSCDFGQPFDTMEEYQAFLKFYFGLDESDIPEEYTNRHLHQTPEGYYLPNPKECGIIIIRKEDLA